MEYKRFAEEIYSSEETAVTLGKFDGLHKGHRKLLRKIKELQNQGYKGVVFTLNPQKLEVLLTEEERKEMVKKMGIHTLIDCPLTKEIAHMEAEDFVRKILVGRLKARHLVVGEDFCFGYQRKGNCQLLLAMQKACGFQVEVVKKKDYEGREISSTYIREALEAGNMGLVTELLGRPYSITGEVLHGRNMGRAVLGMPTTNLVPDQRKLLPPNGVYASKTLLEEDVYPGITNIGYKPTVGEKFRGVETFMFDFDRDLYGKHIQVQLFTFERPEMKFESLERLKERMHMDIEFGKEYFGV